jgi:hypothetical protein
MFGVAALNTGAYIRFWIGYVFQCQVSDGENTWQSDVTWDSDWTGANVVFRIRWESGCAKFFVDGTKVCTISDTAEYATGDVFSVPSGPLSLYLLDGADNSMTVGDVIVRGTQSFVMNPKTSDTTPTNPTGKLSLFQNVTVTSNVELLIPVIKLPFVSGGLSQSVSVSENISLKVIAYEDFDEDVTVSDVIAALRIPIIHINATENNIVITEEVTGAVIGPVVPLVVINDSVTASEEAVVLLPELLVSLTENNIIITEGEVEMTRVVGP